jgi:hypothetical protein
MISQTDQAEVVRLLLKIGLTVKSAVEKSLMVNASKTLQAALTTHSKYRCTIYSLQWYIMK